MPCEPELWLTALRDATSALCSCGMDTPSPGSKKVAGETLGAAWKPEQPLSNSPSASPKTAPKTFLFRFTQPI